MGARKDGIVRLRPRVVLLWTPGGHEDARDGHQMAALRRGALSMGLGMKRNGSSTVGARVTKGNDGGWVQGACLTVRDGAARLTRRFHGQGFLVWFAGTDARRAVFVVGLNWAPRLGGSPSSWPSWIPRAGSLPSGQDGFV